MRPKEEIGSHLGQDHLEWDFLAPAYTVQVFQSMAEPIGESISIVSLCPSPGLAQQDACEQVKGGKSRQVEAVLKHVLPGRV